MSDWYGYDPRAMWPIACADRAGRLLWRRVRDGLPGWPTRDAAALRLQEWPGVRIVTRDELEALLAAASATCTLGHPAP